MENTPVKKKSRKKIDWWSRLGVVVALVFGLWGIRLTYKSIDTSVDINHFDTLLRKTDNSLGLQAHQLSESASLIKLSQTEIDSLVSINKNLSTQLKFVSNQYALNLKEQSIADSNAKNSKTSNEAIFYTATQNLHTVTWNTLYLNNLMNKGSTQLRLMFINEVAPILNSQLNNPFLLSNKNMFQDWLNIRDSIYLYQQNINFYPQIPSDTVNFQGKSFAKIQTDMEKEWRNCYIDLMTFEQVTTQYMAYYKFRGSGVRKHPYMNVKKLKELEGRK